MATLGRHEAALADLGRAITLLHRGGDQVWEARARNHRFLVHVARGQAARADRDLVVAARLFAANGQELESTMAVHNRADVAFHLGDLPAALEFLDRAAAGYAALGVPMPEVALDRSAVLLAAGLATEALTSTDEEIRRHIERGGEATQTAELLFAAARSALAAGRADRAGERAAAARDLFHKQRRGWWEARASFVVLQARYAAGERGDRLRAQSGRLADLLEQLHAREAPAAHLLAGRLAAGQGRTLDADRHLAGAARFRHRGPSFGQPAGWLAHALRAEMRGATAAVLIACRRGLHAAAEHQPSLGAPELRAHAAAYGTELAAIPQRYAVRRGDARMLLEWSELWRASALAVPAARPPDDRESAAELAALREVVRRLDAARATNAPTARLDQDRRRLEAAVRARTRRTTGTGPLRTGDHAQSRSDLANVIDGLGQHRLVELTTVDNVLYATTVVGRRVRCYRVGPLAAAVREVDLALFVLRRLAHGRPPPNASATIERAAEMLEQALLGPAIADLAGAPVVVVPPSQLPSAPWGLLPSLRTSPVVVAPSARLWLRAEQLTVPRRRRVALVIGPGLDGGVTEVKEIGASYPDAVVLSEGQATADRTLAVLDRAWLAHVAAHGVFRRENPLFSSISLDDGPLTGYDLGRLRRTPLRLVLSSCESAVAAAVGADALLGMASVLMSLGTSSILASVVPVNDTATARLMVGFHEHLRAGLSFGEALVAVRAAVDGDPVSVATACSFVAPGR
ncbi:MAG: CHAT domain-containing protein [Sporichthyaceae bacterium]|nr:CHAT domain-containing protein [Sporichthyaceae bacterium]